MDLLNRPAPKEFFTKRFHVAIQGLLAEQYEAVLPLLGYYQFMEKYFTPGYLSEIVAARG